MSKYGTPTEVGQLDIVEFNKRCRQVFDTKFGDVFYGIEVYSYDGAPFVRTCIQMEETDCPAPFDYEPNMNDRPHALEYLLGKRDDFDD